VDHAGDGGPLVRSRGERLGQPGKSQPLPLVGVVAQAQVVEPAVVLGNEAVGAPMAVAVCRRWKLSNDETERVAWLVRHHQYLGSATSLRESKLKKIMAHPGIGELIDLHEADALATDGDLAEVDYCRHYLKDQPQGPIDPPLLFTGHDLARLGVKPGPIFKTVLDRVREAQLDREIHDKAGATDLARTVLAELTQA